MAGRNCSREMTFFFHQSYLRGIKFAGIATRKLWYRNVSLRLGTNSASLARKPESPMYFLPPALSLLPSLRLSQIVIGVSGHGIGLSRHQALPGHWPKHVTFHFLPCYSIFYKDSKIILWQCTSNLRAAWTGENQILCLLSGDPRQLCTQDTF